jgi:hypothetical protein
MTNHPARSATLGATTSERLTPDSFTLDLRPPRRASAFAVALERCAARRGWYSLADVYFPAAHLGPLLREECGRVEQKKRLTAAPCGTPNGGEGA